MTFGRSAAGSRIARVQFVAGSQRVAAVIAAGVGGLLLTGVAVATAGTAEARPDGSTSAQSADERPADSRSVGTRGPAPRAATSSRTATPARTANARSAASGGGLTAFLANQTPRLRPVQAGQSPAGVVTGTLSPADPDGDALRYAVTTAPEHGSATVGADGGYSYTPDPSIAATGALDSFAVTVDDSAGGLHFHGLAGLVNALTFGLVGTSGHTATTTVSVTVDPFGGPPPTAAGRLTPADLSFAGFFRVPAGPLADLPYATLAYGGTALASRVVTNDLGQDERHFFLTGHRYANDPLVELVAPGALGGTPGDAPVAELVRYWGDVYDGRKVTAEEPSGSQANANWTEGLLWDEAGRRLLWSYGNWYAAGHQNNPVLGATVLGADGSITVTGPWRTTAESQQTRSFAVLLSEAVSDSTGGAALGLGGKLQSINGAASWGPSLHVIDWPPADSATPVQARTVASHPIAPTQQRTPRAADYDVARNPDGTPDTAGTLAPVDGVGFWTELDETTGAVFVRTGSGDRSALVYTGGQATGLVWYGPDSEYGVADGRGYTGKGNHAQDYRPVLWLVSEADLVAAAQGRLQPWQVNPYLTVDLTAAVPELAAFQGVSAGQPVFAADEGRLYIPFTGAFDGGEPYPVIAVFTVAG